MRYHSVLLLRDFAKKKKAPRRKEEELGITGITKQLESSSKAGTSTSAITKISHKLECAIKNDKRD